MAGIVPDVYPRDGALRETAGRPADGLTAVLFDMDGTLVETEQYWGEAMFALARRLGGRLSDAARERTVGTSMRVAMDVLYTDLQVSRSERQFRADARWIEDTTAALMTDGGVTWRPGARELLAEVRAGGLPTALVTTTPRRLARIVLRHIAAELGEVFDLTVCGDEVPARKPDPAPYLQAAAALRVDAGRCAVVEDSLAGVTSALAAGAAVLGVPSLQPLAPAPGLTLRASLVGVRLADLAALVADREQDDPAA
jgi:HAD superfamily hydrolase (TIGR01509 family)